MVSDQGTDVIIECLFILSNITGSSSDSQIQCLLNSRSVLEKVYQLARSQYSKIAKEAILTLTNLFITRTKLDPKCMHDLLIFENYHFLETMISASTSPDAELVVEMLQCMHEILSLDEALEL